jgi:hypothetical protein
MTDPLALITGMPLFSLNQNKLYSEFLIAKDDRSYDQNSFFMFKAAAFVFKNFV